MLLCLSADSRGEVDEIVGKAEAAGGIADPSPKDEYDFMYGRSFEDPDGHLWGVNWMDVEAFHAQLADRKRLIETQERNFTMSKITPCLWFANEAEEAANFYVSLLPDSRIETVQRSPADYPHGKAGTGRSWLNSRWPASASWRSTAACAWNTPMPFPS